MSPEAIKALRRELGCTARELAAALEIEQADVLAWEAGERFPTKRFMDRMQALKRQGPSAVPRQKRGKPALRPGLSSLADPRFWKLVRKLAEHPELFERAEKLSADFSDPAESAQSAPRVSSASPSKASELPSSKSSPD